MQLPVSEVDEWAAEMRECASGTIFLSRSAVSIIRPTSLSADCEIQDHIRLYVVTVVRTYTYTYGVSEKNIGTPKVVAISPTCTP
jgi:hypothetical protein